MKKIKDLKINMKNKFRIIINLRGLNKIIDSEKSERQKIENKLSDSYKETREILKTFSAQKNMIITLKTDMENVYHIYYLVTC